MRLLSADLTLPAWPALDQNVTYLKLQILELSAEAAGTDVFCVQGADPEVQAYAMAKYSRSALSMKESLAELDEQKAEQFLNTFYFQYGHRSIADLAHITMAIERLSLLAAIAVVDEQRWDGQERSTRYQDFKKSGYFTPDFMLGGQVGAAARNAESYRETAAFLFSEYEQISEDMFKHLAERTPRPAEMKPEVYQRTLQARAFDLARYLLPLATNTSLGQIVNARTLETQISRLLAHTHAEVRGLGAQLKAAARRGAYNVKHKAWRELAEAIGAKDEALGALAAKQLLSEVPVAPTLVKYAEASKYELGTRQELRQAAGELMRDAEIRPAEAVTLLPSESIETELACTLLYQHCHYPYAQIRERVESLSSAERDEIIALGRATVASTMNFRGRSAPVKASALTFSWTLAPTATCTGIAAAPRSRRSSPPLTVLKCPGRSPLPIWLDDSRRPWIAPNLPLTHCTPP